MNARIQVLRGLAIIAVVSIHTCPSGETQVLFRPFLNFSVALFLFLSGYLTRLENDNWYRFCKKRTVRVIVPYMIWTLIYTLPNITIITLTYNLLTAKAAMTLYFVFVYLQMVFLTPLFGRLVKTKMALPILILLPMTMYILKGFVPLTSALTWLWKTSFLLWFPYYLLGMMLGNNKLRINVSTIVLIMLIFLSLLLQMGEGQYMLNEGMKNPGTQQKLTSFISSVLCLLLAYRFLISERISFKSDILCKIGDFSFGIFLAHILVIRVLKLFPAYNSLPFIINTAIVFSITYLLVCYGSRIIGAKWSKWLGLI